MEKVGVVVIHGVGQTSEGWINQDLVPELERWSAYRSVARDPAADADPDMVLVVASADHVQLAIALDTPAHTQAFFELTDEAASLAEPQFATPALRKRNRDDFVSVVMSITAVHPAEHWLRVLPEAGVPVARAFDPSSTVHRVRDRESSDPTRTWMAFQRVWPLPEREVRITELYWADMSNVGGTVFARLASLFELINEAPHYLGRALLRDSRGDVHGLVRWLLASANWLIRWPVAGLNAAVFLAAFGAIFFMNSGPWLAPFLAAVLALTGICGLIISRRQLHRRPGLADMALSTGLHALLLLALLGAAAVMTSSLLPTTPAPYLVFSILVLLIAWTVWTIPILLAIGLLALIGIKRLFVRRRASSPPLVRPAAALGLNIVLAMLLKFVYAAFGLLVITTLVGTASRTRCPTITQASTQLWSMSDVFATATPACQLDMLKRLLLDVSAFNGIGLALLLVVALVVGGTRRLMTALFPKAAADGVLQLPRMIAHPTILIALAAGAVLNAALVYVPGVADLRLPSQLLGALRESGLEHLGAGALILMVVLLALLVELSGASLHIGRDLVDHQYDRSSGSAAVRFARTRAQAGADPAQPKRYRRRLRIQRRLEALIEDVVTHQGANRLIFLAHSQGTVILRDYLFDHDGLLESRSVQTESLSGLARIDVVTLGSPLTHIYGHYFADDRGALSRDAEGRRPIENVQSWTNLWRVDDPIGQRVDLSPVREVVNRGLPPGGHTDYWREPSVCAFVWSLIEGAPVPAKTQPERAASVVSAA